MADAGAGVDDRLEKRLPAELVADLAEVWADVFALRIDDMARGTFAGRREEFRSVARVALELRQFTDRRQRLRVLSRRSRVDRCGDFADVFKG